MSIPDWRTYAYMSVGTSCLPCCNEVEPIAVCDCLMTYYNFSVIPPEPWAEIAWPEFIIADAVAGCYAVWYEWSGFTVPGLLAFSFTIVSDYEVCWSATKDSSVGGNMPVRTGLTLAAGSTLTVAWNITSGTSVVTAAILLQCDGVTEVASQFDDSPPAATGSFTFPIAQAGEYVLVTQYTFDAGGADGVVEFCISSDMLIAPNPIIIPYYASDMVTVRMMEACPRLFLPPLTESTGDWYANFEAGTAVLASTLVSNCVGYIESLAGLLTFTATDGGTDLTFDVTASAATTTGLMWGSVNAEEGETLTVTFSTDAGTPTGDVNIYDYTGTLVETLSGASALTSAALPYTGRYTVSVEITNPNPEPPFDTATAAITSSGTLSVNPIQALYDLGLTCPGRIDCA